MNKTDIHTILYVHVCWIDTGYVPAKGSLECEFVCQPSYGSPSSAQFFLDDGSNNSLPSDSKSNVLTLLAEVL